MKKNQSGVQLNFLFLLLVVAFFVFNCSQPQEGTTKNTEVGDNTRQSSQDPESTLKCALPNCSGSKCCNKGDEEEKEECEDWCGKSDYLSLSSSAYDKCLSLERKFVEKELLVLFGDNRLKEPDEEELLNIKNEDVETICSAVRGLDKDIWHNLIKEYSSHQAGLVLQWLGVEKSTVEIFEKTKKKEDGIEMLRSLLERVGRGMRSLRDPTVEESADQRILDGLKAKIDFSNEDEQHILKRALDNNNKRLVEFIHKNILLDDDGLCGEDNEKYYPNPNEQVYNKSFTCSDSTKGSNNDHPGYTTGSLKNFLDEANENRQEACILAVYCSIDDTRQGNRFRADLARVVNTSSVRSFIRNSVEKGGLGLPNQKYQDKWTHEVCYHLNLRWKNAQGEGGRVTLDLSLNDPLNCLNP